jgi:hypothetical protein
MNAINFGFLVGVGVGLALAAIGILCLGFMAVRPHSRKDTEPARGDEYGAYYDDLEEP